MKTIPLLVVLLAVAAGCKKTEPPAPKPEAPPKLVLEPRPAVQEAAAVSSSMADSAWQGVAGVPEVEVTKADKLSVAKAKATIASEDPYGEWWKDAPYFDVALLPQNMAMPTLQQATIASVRVQALHDGQSLALRLSWPDASPNGNVDTSRFSDAVAMQMPLDPNAPVTMGAPKMPVQIHHWKAVWQKDKDVGFQDVQDLHPNFWSDLYWFTSGGHPQPVATAFADEKALHWLVANRAGNPMAVLQRTAPCEELSAIGFGSLTHQPNSQTTARGTWFGGRWAVVLKRPLGSDDPADVKVVPGQASKMAFAVWDGGQGQVGARKHWSAWVDVAVAP